MARLFGTDGVRGLANADLTPELALSVAASAARVLAEHDSSHRPVAVVGRDPRASGEMLEAAVAAGLTSAGADVLRLGVLPTPAVAYLVGELGADLGVMISASHNPMPDNGIKFFAAGGHKLPDARRGRDRGPASTQPPCRPTGAAVGRVTDVPTRSTATSTTCLRPPARRWPACGSWSTAPTAPRRPPRPAGLPQGRRRGDRHPRRARRPEHQRRLWLDPPGVAAGRRPRTRRRPGHRARRRRRPLPGGRRRRRRWSTATRSWPCSRWP